MGVRCGGDWVCAPRRAFSLVVSRTWYQWFLKQKNFKSGPGNISARERPWSFLAGQSASTEQTLGCPRRMWIVASSVDLTSFVLSLVEGEPFFLLKTHSSLWAVGPTLPWRLPFPAFSVPLCWLFPFSKQMIPLIVITRNQPTFDCFTAEVHSPQHKTKTLKQYQMRPWLVWPWPYLLPFPTSLSW